MCDAHDVLDLFTGVIAQVRLIWSSCVGQSMHLFDLNVSLLLHMRECALAVRPMEATIAVFV